MDKYGIQEQIKLLQNAKTAMEISERADYFTLIIKENEALKAELKQLEKSDASKEQSSIDYYGLYRELKKEFSAQHELLDQYELGCADVIIAEYIKRIKAVESENKTLKERLSKAEARLKELKGEKNND